MKIIEDSPNRLILKEGAMGARLVGGVMAVAGLGLIGGGVVKQKILIAFGAVLVVIGILVSVFTKSDVVVADKSARQLSVTFSSLKNRTGQTQTCSFDDVSSVLLTQGYSNNAIPNGGQSSGISFGSTGINNGSSQTEIQMNLSVQLRTGAAITIANEQHQASVGIGISFNKLPALGQKLADTLGAPFQQVGEPTLGQALNSVVGAIRGTGTESVVPQPTTPQIPVTPAAPIPTAPLNQAQPPQTSETETPPSQNPPTVV